MNTPLRGRAFASYLPALGWAATAAFAADGPTLPPPKPADAMAVAAVAPHAPLALDAVTTLAMERHPQLAKAALAVDAARGKALQAGLYPNPTVSVTGDELGDRTGPKGVNTLPLVSQEIVTAGKLKLERAAATKEVDQASLALTGQCFALLAGVRSAFFDAVALQRRAEILDELIRIAEQSTAQSSKLVESGLSARLDLVQLEVELERLRADREATLRELPAAYRRLAAVAGVHAFPFDAVAGSLDAPLPPYELERVRLCVVATHPDVLSARVAVDRAQLLLARARVEPVPNVTVSAGYVRQNQNKSDDWTVGVSVPVPVWNRNQGNVRAAEAQVGQAVQEVGRVENELAERAATAYREFASARARAERYRTAIVPKARETLELAQKAYQGGQFEYLRVLEAQRTVGQAELERVRALGDAWKAAAAISGLTLEQQWPPLPQTAAGAQKSEGR